MIWQSSLWNAFGVCTSENSTFQYECQNGNSRKCVSVVKSSCQSSSSSDKMPGINSLVAMIKSRRRRDSIILGVMIGICTIILLTYCGTEARYCYYPCLRGGFNSVLRTTPGLVRRKWFRHGMNRNTSRSLHYHVRVLMQHFTTSLMFINTIDFKEMSYDIGSFILRCLADACAERGGMISFTKPLPVLFQAMNNTPLLF